MFNTQITWTCNNLQAERWLLLYINSWACSSGY